MKERKLEIELPPVSVIIPAYNEEKWIETTVSSVLESRFPCELIVVDDGSTDKTAEILSGFGSKVEVITHLENKGKGAAVASGIRKASGEIIVFLDAHLLGLNQTHLLLLVLPLVQEVTRVTIGQAMPEKPPLSGVFSPFWILSGQRAYFKKDLLPLLSKFEKLGFGIEVFLYQQFREHKTMIVSLPGVRHLLKLDKQPPQQAALSYLKEASEVTRALIGIEDLRPRQLAQLNDELSSVLAEHMAVGQERAKQYLKTLKALLERK